MTKSALITSINGYITSVVNIAKHRNSMLDLINQLFQTTYTMSNVEAPDQFTYNLKFKKQGNLVHIDGFIKNNYPYMRGNEILVTIGNSEFYAKTGQETISQVVGSTSLSNGIVSFALSSIYLVTNLGALSTININTTYQTND